MRLYKPVLVVGQSFVGEKVMTVPDQAMSIREILTRYVRRQPLPQTADGIYVEGLGDLEKMANEDMVDKRERIDSWKDKLSKASEHIKARSQGGGEPLPPGKPPAGDVTGGPVLGQAPPPAPPPGG